MTERLEKLIDELPYSIRYEGNTERLIEFAEEQAERVEELQDEVNRLKDLEEGLRLNIKIKQEGIDFLKQENERYREVLEEIARGRFPGASYKAREVLKEMEK